MKEDFTHKCTSLLHAAIDSIIVGMKSDGSFNVLWQAALSRYQTQTCDSNAVASSTSSSLELKDVAGVFIIYGIFLAIMLLYGIIRLLKPGKVTWTEIMDLYLYQQVLCYLKKHPDEFQPVAVKMTAVAELYNIQQKGLCARFEGVGIAEEPTSFSPEECCNRWIYLMKDKKSRHFLPNKDNAAALQNTTADDNDWHKKWSPIMDDHLLDFFRAETFPFDKIADDVQKQAMALEKIKSGSFQQDSTAGEQQRNAYSRLLGFKSLRLDNPSKDSLHSLWYTPEACFKRFYEMCDGLSAGQFKKETLKHKIDFRMSQVEYAIAKKSREVKDFVAKEGHMVKDFVAKEGHVVKEFVRKEGHAVTGFVHDRMTTHTDNRVIHLEDAGLQDVGENRWVDKSSHDIAEIEEGRDRRGNKVHPEG